MDCKEDNILTLPKRNNISYKDRISMPAGNTPGNIRYKVILLCLFIVSAIALHAQQPVQVNTILRAPYTLRLSDYYASTQEKLVVTLTNRDLNKPVLTIRLRMTIESQAVRLRTREFAVIPVLQLEAGVPLRLSLGDLAPYFTAENLDFSGLSRAQYAQQAKLPEGFYQFCFEAVEVSTGQVASARGCAMAWISLSDPPLLNLPQKGEAIASKANQNIIFQWTPRHLNSPNSAYATEYDFQLVELWDNTLAPEAAFLSMQPLYETTTRTTTLLYGPAQPLLIAGKRYGWRIRARARSGVEEADVFRNQGFSEIYWFTYQEFCPPPSGISAVPGQYGNFDISWMPDGRHSAYMISYRRQDQAGAAWVDQQSSSTLALLYDVQPGLTYEYRVGAFCHTDQPVFSDLQTIRVPDRETNSFANCRIVPDPQITNKQVLNVLKPGDVITAGNFPVKLDQVAGSGSFAGKGYVTVPFLGKAKVRVKFDNIQVNTQNQLIAGTVITTYDEDEGSVVDIDEGLDIFRGYEGIVSRLMGFTADTDIEDLKKLLDKLVENAEQELPDTEAEKVKNTAAELLEAKKAYDHIKNIYDALPDEDPLKKEMKKDLDAAREQFEEIKNRFKGKDENAITTEKYTLRFDRSSPPDTTRYGFDAYKSPRLESNYDLVKHGENKYYIPWKSVPLGGTDWVKAYSITEGEDPDENIVFRSSTGTLPSKVSLPGKEMTVKVHGYNPGEKNEIIAYHTKEIEGKEVNVEIGKLNVVSYEMLYKKVVLVPVNGTILPASQKTIRTLLNEIYRQAIVTWSVEIKPSLSSNYDVTGDGLDDDEQILKTSSYTPEMKTIINDYKRREAIDADVHYLFVVPRSQSRYQGFNPYKKQFGFVFMEEDQTKENGFVATAAHELGHGAFNLKHMWDNTNIPKNSTDNLMDYNLDTRLDKFQWDLIHNPAFRIPFFESDEDAAYKAWTNLAGDVITNIPGHENSTKAFLSLAGGIITLPQNARDFTFINGYLSGFTIGNERYTALSETTSQIFKGYFYDAIQKNGTYDISKSKPYEGPQISPKNPAIFYVLKKDKDGCGQYQVYKATYTPGVGSIIDGEVGNSIEFRKKNIASADNENLTDHSALEGPIAEGINCLTARAKELYKFIIEHYAFHGTALDDQQKSKLAALLSLYKNVLVKGLDVDLDKNYEPEHIAIEMREMLRYGHTEFITRLGNASLAAAGKNTELVVAFEDYHRMKDAYLIYKIFEKADPDCVAGEHVYNNIKAQLETRGSVEFNMEFMTALGKTGLEITTGNEIFELMVCILKSVRIPESFYNPNHFDYKDHALFKELFERVFMVSPEVLMLDMPIEAERYVLACGCGVWNSAIDVIKGIPEFGAGVTQSPDELIRKTREFYENIKKNWAGIPGGMWALLKEHHGYVEGSETIDSYRATYGACYDVVFVASIFIGLRELGLLYQAGKAGDIGKMGLVILNAARNYPGDLARTFKEIILTAGKLSNLAVRKAIFEMIENIPDQIGISKISDANSVIIINGANGEIARFTNEGVVITARPGSSLTGNVKYESTEDIVDVASNTTGKLLLLTDESGKVVAATVGSTRKKPIIKFPDGYDVRQTGLVAEFFNPDRPTEVVGRLYKVSADNNNISYRFEYYRHDDVIIHIRNLDMYVQNGTLRGELNLEDASGMGIGSTIFRDAANFFDGRFDAIGGMWLAGNLYKKGISDNLEAYRNALAAGKTEEEAAFATATGAWAAELGYDRVELTGDRSITSPEVIALFRKSNPNLKFVKKLYDRNNKLVGNLFREEDQGKLKYTVRSADGGLNVPDLPVLLDNDGVLRPGLEQLLIFDNDAHLAILEDAIGFFGKEKINGIHGVLPESDLAAYRQAHNAVGPENAALGTALGKLMAKSGFTRVIFEGDNSANAFQIRAVFTRRHVAYEMATDYNARSAGEIATFFFKGSDAVGTLSKEIENGNSIIYTYRASNASIPPVRERVSLEDGVLKANLSLMKIEAEGLAEILLNDMADYFGNQRITAISDVWEETGLAENLKLFKGSLEGKTVWEAARLTLTGKLAEKLGLFRIIIEPNQDLSPNAKSIYISFARHGVIVKDDFMDGGKPLGILYRETGGNDNRLLYYFETFDGREKTNNQKFTWNNGETSASLKLPERLKEKRISSAIFEDAINEFIRRQKDVKSHRAILTDQGDMRDQYDIFEKAFKESGSAEDAALATPTGRILTRLVNFTRVQVIRDAPDPNKIVNTVTAIFTREEAGFVTKVFTPKGTGQVCLGRLHRQVEGDIVTYTFRFTDPALHDISEQVALTRGIFQADFEFLRAPNVKGQAYANDIARAMQEDAVAHFGNRITTISDEWNINEGDYRLYQEALRTGTPWEAAFATRSGQLAKAREFTRVVFPNQGEEITPVFNKLNVQFRQHGPSIKNIADKNGAPLGILYREPDDVPAMFTYYFESVDGKLKVNNLTVQMNGEGILSALFKIPAALQDRKIATEILTDAQKQFNDHGLSVRSFSGNWSNQDDMVVNYQAFLEEFKKLGDAEDAALATPTGKIISRLFEFNRVVVTRDDARGQVIALFSAEREGFIKKIRDNDNRTSGKLYRNASDTPDEASYTFELPGADVAAINERIVLSNGVLHVNVIQLLKTVRASDLKRTLLNDIASYFGKEKIQGIHDIWNDSNEDYALYLAALQSQTPEQAAFATITGQWASKHGFNHVEFLTENAPDTRTINVRFTKQREPFEMASGYDPRKPGPIATFFDQSGNAIGHLSKDVESGEVIYYTFKFPDGNLPAVKDKVSLSDGIFTTKLNLQKIEIADLTTILLKDAEQYFGKENITVIRNVWTDDGKEISGGLINYRAARNAGQKPEDAALSTPIGQWAKNLPLTRAEFTDQQDISATSRRIVVLFKKERTFVQDCHDDQGNFVGKLYKEPEVINNRIVYYFESADGSVVVKDNLFMHLNAGVLGGNLNLKALQNKKVGAVIFRDAVQQFGKEKIETFLSVWEKSDDYEGGESINLTIYREGLNTMDAEDAALATPSGKLIKNTLEFTNVTFRGDHSAAAEHITAHFSREDKAFIKKIYNGAKRSVGKLYRPASANRDELNYVFRFSDPTIPAVTGRVSLRDGALDLGGLDELARANSNEFVLTLAQDILAHFGEGKIKSIRDLWTRESENFRVYQEGLRTGTAWQAAHATLSGQLAQRLGLPRPILPDQRNGIPAGATGLEVQFRTHGALVKACKDNNNTVIGSLYREPITDNTRQIYYFESSGGVFYDNIILTLNGEGVLIVALKLPASEKRTEVYAAILEDAKHQFGSRIVALQDHWSGEFNDGNYEAYLRAFKMYSDPELAALATPIGKGAAEQLGLTSARASEAAGVVTAVFTKERKGFVGKIFGKDNGNYVGKLYRESEADINNLVYYCEPASGAPIIDLVVILDKDGTLTRELNLAKLENTDIHTAILKDALVQYAAQGKFIKTFQDRWHEGSESHNAFRQALTINSDPEVAASATPWGLILAEHLGFNSVDIIWDPSSVMVIFTKEIDGYVKKLFDKDNAAIAKLYRAFEDNEVIYALKLPERRLGNPVFLSNQSVFLDNAEDIVDISFELGYIRGSGAARQILDDADNLLKIRAGKNIRNIWRGNSEDLIIYRENIAAGMTRTEAALATPSGQWAVEREFTSVKFEGDNSPAAQRVVAVFSKKERTRVVELPGYDAKKSGPIAEFFEGTESLGILSKEIEGVKGDRLYYAFHFTNKGVAPITENVHAFLDNDGIITATLNLERVSGHGVGSVIRTDVEKCWGDRIKGVHATWVEDADKVVFKNGESTNLNQYRKVLKATGNHALAALSTFTGKWAEALKCTDVTFIGDNSLTSPKIEVLFTKKK